MRIVKMVLKIGTPIAMMVWAFFFLLAGLIFWLPQFAGGLDLYLTTYPDLSGGSVFIISLLPLWLLLSILALGVFIFYLAIKMVDTAVSRKKGGIKELKDE